MYCVLYTNQSQYKSIAISHDIFSAGTKYVKNTTKQNICRPADSCDIKKDPKGNKNINWFSFKVEAEFQIMVVFSEINFIFG